MNQQKPEYLNKSLASKRSGLSVRRLLELASRGTIRKKLIRDPENGNRSMAVFDSRDIERLRTGDRPPTTALQISRPVRPIATTSHRVSASVIPPTPKMWMDAEEAAEYSGLPAKCLLRLVRSGKLPAIDAGVREGGRWRIARRDIDGLNGERVRR